MTPREDHDDHPGWVTTTEAAQRLGVKRATLYAYVSRGLLTSRRRPGQQESLFDRAQVDTLAGSTRPAGTPQPVLRFRNVATSVSSQVDGELRYRGVALEDVAASMTLEDAAALVVGTSGAGTTPATGATGATVATGATAGPVPPGLVGLLAALPLERRMPVAVHALGALDPFGLDTDAERVRRSALGTIPHAVALLADAAAPGARRHAPTAAALAWNLVTALRGRPGTKADREVVRVLLVALLDHGLTASTVAARVAASTRAGATACLGAAYAAMSGPLHGAAPAAAHALLADPGSAEHAAGRALADGGSVPGFGHFLYPDGDPRADVVLDALWRRPGTTRLRERVERLTAAVTDRTGRAANIDLASAAVLHALGLPAAAGEVVFQVARSFGVVAHVVEEYAEEPLRWRGREATG